MTPDFVQCKSWYWIIFKRPAPSARWRVLGKWFKAPVLCKIGRHKGFNVNDRGLMIGTGIVDYWCADCGCVAWQQHISDSPKSVRQDFKDIQSGLAE